MQVIEREIHTIDAEGKVPGRLATTIAGFLIGKHKPSYQPNLDMGDHVQVLNASKMKIGTNKLTQKKYYSHSGYAGGLKTKTMQNIWDENPSQVLLEAVSKMLPKNKLRNERMKRLVIEN